MFDRVSIDYRSEVKIIGPVENNIREPPMIRIIRLHLPFFAIILLYLGLLLPTLTRQGISWDEQTDLEITQSYTRPGGWLIGSALDPSQTRLPHASVAVVFLALHTDSLTTARMVSAAVGLLTLVGVYIYCYQVLNLIAASAAALLLATSPFFLSFARVAFTETDIYLACALVWMLLAIEQYRRRPVLGWAAAIGLLYGLALSAKFTVLSILPAVFYAVAWRKQTGSASWQSAAVGAAYCALGVGTLISSMTLINSADTIYYASLLFTITLTGWVAGLLWLTWNRELPAPVLPTLFIVIGLAWVTFLLIPPEHLANPRIILSLQARFASEMRLSQSSIGEAAGLHILSILFKSSPLIGLGLIIAWVAVLFQIRRPVLRMPILVSLLYFCGLCLLPLAQTFYTVPLLPLLTIFLAERFYKLLTSFRLAAVTAGILAVLLLVIDLAACYPDFNLNGFQWIGARRLAGRPSIGYRSVVQTPSDGVQQVTSWLNANTAPGAKVTSYILESHIVAAYAQNSRFEITNGFKQGPRPDTDYVITAINNEIPQSWWTSRNSETVFSSPYDSKWLTQHYEKVYSVQRVFGVEMASVWKKK